MWQRLPICLLFASGFAFAIDPNNCSTELCQLASNGSLPELRWPDFQNYRDDVIRLYKSNSFQPVWVKNSVPTPSALGVISALKTAYDDGLSPEDYDGSRWDERIANIAAFGPNRFDVALTVAAMRFASDLRFGRANPDGKPTGVFPLDSWVLQTLAPSADAKAAFQQLNPPFPGYGRIRGMLPEYWRLAQQDSGETLPVSAKPIEPGKAYSGVSRLAEVLRCLGDLPTNAALPESGLYDGALVDAVKHFQARHGLEPDGRLGKGTLAALNTPMSHRFRQLQLA